MNFLKKINTIVTVCLLVACGSSEQTKVNSPVRNAKIISGNPQDPTLSPQILRIDITYNDGTSGFCTGTVIGTNSILTAGHCLSGATSTFVTRPDGRIVNVAQSFVHPSYSIEPMLQAIFYDVAILRTSESLNLPVLGILTSLNPLAPFEVSIYGYGLDENGEAGSLRSGMMLIQTVTPNHLIATFDGLSNTCNGDSGGPATYTVLDENGSVLSVSVAGITSSGSLENCAEGDTSLFTNLQNPEIISFISGLVPEVVLQ